MSARPKPGQKRTKRQKRRDAKYMQLRRYHERYWDAFDRRMNNPSVRKEYLSGYGYVDNYDAASDWRCPDA